MSRPAEEDGEKPTPGPAVSRISYLDILRDPKIRIVIFGTFVVMLGFGILSPILPLYARSFGVGYGAVGLLNSCFAGARLVFDLLVGPLVRRFGERVVVTAGAAIVGTSSILAASAPNFPLLVVFRSAGGAGSSMFFAALMSYLLRTAPKDRLGRVMGVFYGAFNIGIILGNPIGGFVGRTFGLASPLLFYGGACYIAAALYIRRVQDPPRTEEGNGTGSLRDLRWSRELVAVLIAIGAYLWMVGGVFQTLLSLFERDRFGLSLTAIGGLATLVGLAEFVVLFPAGSATDRRGRKAVLVPSYVGIVLVVGVLGLATQVWMVALGLVALGVVSGYGGVPQSVMLADVVPAVNQPAAIGVFRFVGDLGFVMGPLVAGNAASAFGFGAAFALSALPCLIALMFLTRTAETRPPDAGPDAPGAVSG